MVKKIKNNKKGSMMLDYFILLAVGLIILVAFVGFLGEGETLIKNSAKKYKEIASDDNQNLGKFK